MDLSRTVGGDAYKGDTQGAEPSHFSTAPGAAVMGGEINPLDVLWPVSGLSHRNTFPVANTCDYVSVCLQKCRGFFH